MNQYETVFILTPVLSDDQAKETVAKFKNLLTDGGAEILNEEAWGLKKLAYHIQKKTITLRSAAQSLVKKRRLKLWQSRNQKSVI